MTTLEEYLKYKETERFLDSLVVAKPIPHFVPPKHTVKRKNPFGLERVRSFLAELGNPQVKNTYIHIAGTSGKTSTTYFTANIFQSQGYKTAMFISPPICTFAEVFTINMKLPPVQEIIALVEQSKSLIDREYETKNMGVISYSEFVLAMAFTYFAMNHVDYVALEAFLGGRYDATNVIEKAEVSIITNIRLDHTHLLGNTLLEIASDKVGIVKEGCPLVTAEEKSEILEIFQKEAHKFHTKLQILGKEFRVENVQTRDDETVFDYVSDIHTYRKLQTSMCGSYQATNAALAIRALEIVSKKNMKNIDEDALKKGLLATVIPARYEKVNADPVVILDGAHNPDKIAHLVLYLKSRFQSEEVIFICGFTSGKNPQDMFQYLLEVSNTFYLTRILIGYREDEEPLYLKSVLTSLCPSVKAIIKLDPFAALDMAIEEAKKQGKIVCVTGSLYLVAYLRQRWYPEYKVLQDV
jgi:dihydrofolate synthase/folylpolyglutamate synthase